MHRYELLLSTETNLWECVDFVDAGVPDLSVQQIKLSGSAAMSATFGGITGKRGVLLCCEFICIYCLSMLPSLHSILFCKVLSYLILSYQLHNLRALL